MSQDSDRAVCNGEAPPKPSHSLSENPPTSHTTDRQSLREYHLDRFISSPNSVPLASVQTATDSNAQEAHQRNLATEVEAIMAPFG
ncbi:hypothetical protein F4811DRAFT_201560 [Daldinia bambusicola]|nr:hypothetical protein F4811DRAFT_201560 [Daldinia bambusicola]